MSHLSYSVATTSGGGQVEQLIRAIRQIREPYARLNAYRTHLNQLFVGDVAASQMLESMWHAFENDELRQQWAADEHVIRAEFAEIGNRVEDNRQRRNKAAESYRRLERLSDPTIPGQDWIRIVDFPSIDLKPYLIREAARAASFAKEAGFTSVEVRRIVEWESSERFRLFEARADEAARSRGPQPCAMDYTKVMEYSRCTYNLKFCPAPERLSDSHAEAAERGIQGDNVLSNCDTEQSCLHSQEGSRKRRKLSQPPSSRVESWQCAMSLERQKDVSNSDDDDEPDDTDVNLENEEFSNNTLEPNDDETLAKEEPIATCKVKYGEERMPNSEEQAEAATKVNNLSISRVDNERPKTRTTISASGIPVCDCSHGVTDVFLRSITGKAGRPRALRDAPSRLAVCRNVARIVGRGATLCGLHIRRAAASAGLRSRGVRHAELCERMATIGSTKDKALALMRDSATYKWFHAQSRPRHAIELRGMYKYDPVCHRGEPPFEPSVDAIIEQFRQRYNVDIRSVFEHDSTIILPLFKWWWSTDYPVFVEGAEYTIAQLVDEEFDLYHWHQRYNAGPTGCLGWVRNMYHANCQQLMRMDPEYYRLYVALRADHRWRIVSYPYYTKYSKPGGEKNQFRHIDMNVAKYVEQDGFAGDMIQGTLSLDDEDPGNCTELVRGFTADKVRAWWGAVVERTGGHRRLDRPVNDLGHSNGAWCAEDEINFGAFTPSPCLAGEVRVTKPIVPHGSLWTPAGDSYRRRTMLPWFVGIEEDHATMEVPDMGTWEDLRRSHLDMLPGPASPSGLHNMHGNIPYPFPAAQRLRLGLPLSDALVGRERWDDAAVEEARDIVLGNSAEAYDEYLHQFRLKAARALGVAMTLLRKAERKSYGHKSFYNCAGLDAPPSDDKPTPDMLEKLTIINRDWSSDSDMPEQSAMSDDSG